MLNHMILFRAEWSNANAIRLHRPTESAAARHDGFYRNPDRAFQVRSRWAQR
ncbi:MAG: hypothetical protein AAGD23_11110 [Pseudomonadota bacterium]